MDPNTKWGSDDTPVIDDLPNTVWGTKEVVVPTEEAPVEEVPADRPVKKSKKVT